MNEATESREAMLRALEAEGADLAALRANLRLTPTERIAELVAMNRFHHAVQTRTLDPAVRSALEQREVEAARQRLIGAGA